MIEFLLWLKTRPECVQRLAAEFPPGGRFMVKGEQLHVIGWNESDMVILSPVDPAKDYEEALRRRVHVCAKHLR